MLKSDSKLRKDILNLINKNKNVISNNNAIVKKLSSGKLNMERPLVCSEQTWNELNSKRSNEQLMSMVNTEMIKNDQNLALQFTFVKGFLTSRFNNTMNNVFNQYVQIPGITFSGWLTLLFNDKIEEIFEYYELLYNTIINNRINNYNYQNDLDFINFNLKTGFNGKGIIYLKDENYFMIYCGNKSIEFKFKKIDVFVNEYSTPGFSILLRRYETYQYAKKRVVSNKNLILKDSVFKINDTIEEKYLVETISKYLRVHPDVYLNTINKISRQVLLKDNKLLFIQLGRDTDLNYKKLIRYNFNENFKAGCVTLDSENFWNTEYIDLNLVFFSADDLVDNLYKHRNETYINFCLYNLLINIISKNRPVKLENYSGDEFKEYTYSEFSDFKSVKKQNIVDDVCFKGMETTWHEECHYTLEGENKDSWISKYMLKNSITYTSTNTKFNKIVDKMGTLNLNKARVFSLLNKMNKGIFLKDKEIRYISLFYCFSDKNSSNCSNIKIREILEFINITGKNSKFRNFTLILQKRYGGLSNIICCLFFCVYHVKFSNYGLELLRNLNWLYVKDEFWVSVFSNLNQFVKQNNIHNGNIQLSTDFKNLQYIETFIGPLMNDGKNSIEVISQRVYKQFNKTCFINLILDGDGYEYANNVCDSVMLTYWEQVFTSHKHKLNGIYKQINLRDKFSTDSSTGGLVTMFRNKEIVSNIKEYDPDFTPTKGNKKTAFTSESTQWYFRFIYDIPVTLCDMVMKRNERGKYRYIYSVTMQHYLCNSVTTHEFERQFNKIGVQVILDESETLKENFKQYKYSYFNCIDYSEFNDQHEVQHKKSVWSSYSKKLKEKFGNDIELDGYLLCSKWMQVACETMLLRVNSDNSIYYQHEGRLFSGERATTLTNSLMSVFYYVLIKINQYIFNNINNIKESENSEYSSIYKCCLGAEIDKKDYLFEVLDLNVCLGDDGVINSESIEDSLQFNEIAVLSGLMLKTTKCLICYKSFEFLRKWKKFDNNFSISKGYVNRGISSLVCGNPEGKSDKIYRAWIEQIYNGFRVIVARSSNSSWFSEFVEILWKKISKLKQKNKELSNEPLPKEILWISQKQNGFGFTKFNGKVLKNKYTLPSIPNPTSFVPRGFTFNVDTKAMDVLIDEEILPSIIKYGTVNEKAVASRKFQNMLEMVRSNTSGLNLYDNVWMKEEYIPYNIKIKKLINVTETDHEDVILTSDDLRKFEIVENDYINSNGMESTRGLSVDFKRITALERNLELIKLKISLKEVLIEEFGTESYNDYLVSENLFMYGNACFFIEPSLLNTIIGYMKQLFRYDEDVSTIRKFTTYIFNKYK